MQPPSFDAAGDTGEAAGRTRRRFWAATRKVCAVCGGRSQPALHDGAAGSAGDHGLILRTSSRRCTRLESAACCGAKKLAAAKKQAAKVAAEMTGLLAEEDARAGRSRLRSVCWRRAGEGDMLRTQLAILRRLVKVDTVG